MTMQEMQDRMEIRELTDIFANLADVKDVEGQGRLFLEDGVLEFQMGTEGQVNEIRGRQAIVEAFRNTVGPAKLVYHINGQQTLTSYAGDEAEGTAYPGQRRSSFYRPQPCTCNWGAVSNRIWTKRTGAGPATAKCTCRPAW